MQRSRELIFKFNKAYEIKTMERVDTLFKQNKNTILPFAQVGRHIYEMFKIAQPNKDYSSFIHHIDDVLNDFKNDLRNGVRKAEINIIVDTLIQLYEDSEYKYVRNIIKEYKKVKYMTLSNIEYKNNQPCNDDMVYIGESIWIIEQINKYLDGEYNSFKDCIYIILESCRDRYYLIMAMARALE